MSGTIATATIIGRLTRDAELRYVGDQALCQIGLATDTRVRLPSGEWGDEPSFWDVEIWGKQAQSLSPYLEKGKLIHVLGEMSNDRWEKDGQPRTKLKISAKIVTLLPSGSPRGERQERAPRQDPAPMPMQVVDEEIPF